MLKDPDVISINNVHLNEISDLTVKMFMSHLSKTDRSVGTRVDRNNFWIQQKILPLLTQLSFTYLLFEGFTDIVI